MRTLFFNGLIKIFSYNKHMKTIAFLGVSVWLLLLNNSRESYAQTQMLRFEHITAEQGLPDNTALCSMQDSKGFLWFGTYNGLCRYDGYNFTTYQFDPNDTTSIGGNVITRIFESCFANRLSV